MKRGKRPEVEMRTVPCDGQAHRNPHIDHCMVCLGGQWGELQVPAAFPDLQTYRQGGDVMIGLISDAAVAADGERDATWDYHDVIREMWRALDDAGKARAWQALARMRATLAIKPEGGQ
jgi:hypothetical protein